MARRGRRYDDGAKLNLKKVFAVAIIILIIIAGIIGIKNMLSSNSSSLAGKIENVYYYTIYKDGKWGVVNSYGENIIEPTYDEMIVIPNNAQDIFVCTYDVDYANKTYKTKVVNKKGKEVIKGFEKIEAIPNIDDDGSMWYEENIFIAQKDGKYGLINYSGKEILGCEYDSIKPLQGAKNSYIIEKNKKYGICDDAGNVVIEPKYKEIKKIGTDYKNGYIVINEEGKSGIISFDKSTVLAENYEEIKPIVGDNAYVIKAQDKYSVINKEGTAIFEKTFDDVTEINKENIVAVQEGKYGVVDMAGETKIDFQYEDIHYASDNSYIVKKDGKYGVISSANETLLPFEYEEIEYISSGNFMIASNTQNGEKISKIFDANFEEKISGKIDELNKTKGYMRVYTDETYKFYNFKFEEKKASEILTANKLFAVSKDGKFGFADKSGNIVIGYIYDDVTEQNSSGYAGIKKDGLWGAINLNGDVVVQPKYNLDKNEKIDFIGKWHLCEDMNANYYLDI